MIAIENDTRPGTLKLTSGGLITLLSGAFLSVMSAIIVNVAIPSIQQQFSASPAAISAVVAYYGLAYGVMLITGGRLGDLYGRRRIFIAGLAAFTVVSMLCGLAGSMPTLIGARVVQGIAAAVMFPQVLSIIRVALEDERDRARAFGVFGVVLGLSAIAGPLIGGALISANLWGTSSWRLVFLVNVPIGALACFAAKRLIPESRSADARRLDMPGVLLCAAGLGLMLHPLIEGRHAGWSTLTMTSMIAAVPVLISFAFDQHRKARRRGSPLVDPALFAIPAFFSGLVIAFLFHATIIATLFTLALFLQVGLKYAAFDAALIVSPTGVSFLAASIIGNRLLPSFGAFIVMLFGSVINVIGYAAYAAIAIGQQTPDGWSLIPALVATGFGQGLFLPPLLNAVLARTSKEQAGSASGVVATAQQVGGAFGVAITGILYFGALLVPDASSAQSHAHAFSLTMAFQTATALLVLCLLPLLFWRGPQPPLHRDPQEMTR